MQVSYKPLQMQVNGLDGPLVGLEDVLNEWKVSATRLHMFHAPEKQVLKAFLALLP